MDKEPSRLLCSLVFHAKCQHPLTMDLSLLTTFLFNQFHSGDLDLTDVLTLGDNCIF